LHEGRERLLLGKKDAHIFWKEEDASSLLGKVGRGLILQEGEKGAGLRLLKVYGKRH